MTAKSSIRRCLLPLAVFVVGFVLHAIYMRHLTRLPVRGWADTGIVDDGFWGLQPYIEGQGYFIGYSYALSLAFFAVAVRRYREERMCAARNLAAGTLTLTGFLSFAGCFLIGCCGSPMLGVYLSLFGVSYLPWTKPLVAGVTTVMIAGSYWWIRWRSRKEKSCEPWCTPCSENAVSGEQRQ